MLLEPRVQPLLELALQGLPELLVDVLAEPNAVAALAGGQLEERLVAFLDRLGAALGAARGPGCGARRRRRVGELVEDRIGFGRRDPLGEFRGLALDLGSLIAARIAERRAPAECDDARITERADDVVGEGGDSDVLADVLLGLTDGVTE